MVVVDAACSEVWIMAFHTSAEHSDVRFAAKQVAECDQCGGTGQQSTPCNTCGGDGRVRKSKKVTNHALNSAR